MFGYSPAGSGWPTRWDHTGEQGGTNEDTPFGVRDRTHDVDGRSRRTGQFGPTPQNARSRGRIVTVPSPLVVDSRQIDPIATPCNLYDALRRDQQRPPVNIADFPLDRTTFVDLELETRCVRSAGGPRPWDRDGDVPIARPNLATLRGSIVGIPGSKVYLAISPNMSNGIIEFDGTTYVVSNGSFAQQTGITITTCPISPMGRSTGSTTPALITPPDQEYANSRRRRR